MQLFSVPPIIRSDGCGHGMRSNVLWRFLRGTMYLLYQMKSGRISSLWAISISPTQSVSEDARQRTVALYAPSKTFNLAGLVGSYHIIYNDWIRDRVEKESSCPTTMR